MTERQEFLCGLADKFKDETLQAERWLWEHPQTGYTEWEAHAFMVEKFEKLGYKLVRADQDPRFGKIPGFYTDIDTGKPGPTLCIMGELDALDIANHPESVNGMTHCCGHHAQSAALFCVAAALAQPGALDGLCGKIRLMSVPAEEMIQLGFREGLRQQGVIHYFGGKTEFMYRGYFDGVDLSIMVHSFNGEEIVPGKSFVYACEYEANGCVAKNLTYKGKSSHAGGAPEKGINAQYAAILGMEACNALRETFVEADTIRFHPIIMGVKSAVNIIPDELKIETYIRGGSLEAMLRENKKMNRALAGGAVSMGAGLEIHDRPGYAPERHDRQFMKLVEECCVDIAGADKVGFDYNLRTTGSSDFGDLTCVMPGVQWNCAGFIGEGHGIDFKVVDPYTITVMSAKSQLVVTDALLRDGAEKAKKIIADYEPQFPSIAAYFEAISEFDMDKDAVTYGEDGRVTVDYMK